MSQPEIPTRVKLFASLIYVDSNVFREALDMLKAEFGEPDFLSEEFSFPGSNYYRPEMGDIKGRKFITFREPVDPGDLAGIKLISNRIEMELAGESKVELFRPRRVNIDPGLLSESSLVLATAKQAPRRIYLAKGIWADLTLVFENGSMKPMDRTYPDYASCEVITMINSLRKAFLASKALSREAGEK